MIIKLLLDLFKALFRSTSSGPQPAPAVQRPPAVAVPSWMPLVLKEIGFKEKPGNRGLDKYLAKSKTGNNGDPWCAIFANWAFESVGIPGTRSAMARSFEKNANFVKLAGPAYGAVGTLWRQSRSSGLGHVFFYVGHDANDRIIGVGGNQNNGVTQQSQPISRFVGWYWPRGVPLPKIGKVDILAAHVSEGTEV